MTKVESTRHEIKVPGNPEETIPIDLLRVNIPSSLDYAKMDGGVTSGYPLHPDALAHDKFQAIVLKEPGNPGNNGAAWKPGKFVIDKVPKKFDPFRIYAKSFSKSSVGRNNEPEGGWGVMLKPNVVGLCPTDTAGGSQEFPVGNIRKEGIPGHEVVYTVIGAHPVAVNVLREQGIELGDIVVGDINIGCGGCPECDRGRAAIHCANTLTFAGVGSDENAVKWVKDQIGLDAVPGGYTEGLVVMPTSALTKVDSGVIETREDMALFAQADAVACAISSMRAMHIHPNIPDSFQQIRGYDDPNILIVGSGRLGMWHGYLLRKYLPNANLFTVDVSEGNSKRVGDFLDIGPRNRHVLSDMETSQGGEFYSPGGIGKAFPHVFQDNGRFHMVIDCAGHGTITGPTLREMYRHIIAKGGQFVTTAHTGIPEGELAGLTTGNRNMQNQAFNFALSPQENMETAIRILEEDIRDNGDKGLRSMITFIEGGLHYEHPNPEPGEEGTLALPDLIGLMPGKVREELDGTVFTSDLIVHKEDIASASLQQILFLAAIHNVTGIRD